MDIDTLLANLNVIQFECFISDPNAITIVINSKQKRPLYPNCYQPSESLHSHYQRAVSDLPWHNTASSRFDAKLLSRLCFRKEKLNAKELKMLFHARAKSDQLDQAFSLAEEFVKIIRGHGSMAIGLWIAKSLFGNSEEVSGNS